MRQKNKFRRGSIGHHGAEYIQHTASHRIASHHYKSRIAREIVFDLRAIHTRKHREAHTRHAAFFSERHMYTDMRLRFCYIYPSCSSTISSRKRTSHSKNDLVGCFLNKYGCMTSWTQSSQVSVVRPLARTSAKSIQIPPNPPIKNTTRSSSNSTVWTTTRKTKPPPTKPRLVPPLLIFRN